MRKQRLPYRKRVKYAYARDYEPLTKVATMSAVARAYCRTPTNVSQYVDLGRLAAVKCGGVVLISLASVRRLWGDPINPDIHDFI